jgi:hypothetical protein
MNWSGLERNKLDYILTDLLPVELSERFSFRSFYDFLLQKKQQNSLKKITEQMKKACAESKGKIFDHAWGTMPLKYNILKGNDSFRHIGLIQPFSALNIYIFMECFQRDILNFFENNHRFSIRYHRKSNDLYYKTSSKKTVCYTQKHSRKLGRNVLQQTGRYFMVYPFESINAFTASQNWRMCNHKYKYFAKEDYKSCFDSIYSHVFKQIIERNVVDSKSANNSNLFLTIDRMLMNINGKSSNGIVVGPEYSRLIAEILLQHIDTEVYLALAQNDYEWEKDYKVFRYVDDIYIFTNKLETREAIIGKYRDVGRKYLLNLNEQKSVKRDTPMIFNNWIEKTRILTDKIDKYFESIKEYKELDKSQQCPIKKSQNISINRMKDEFIVLIKEFPDVQPTIVSFLLSTLLNKMLASQKGHRLFEKNKTDKAITLIEFALFIYAMCPNFDSTRKVISMLSCLDKKVEFSQKDSSENDKLQRVINQYSFVFQRANLPDICDWFVLFNDFSISLDLQTECNIIQVAERIDNPIIWANILLYSHYHQQFFEEIKLKITEIVDGKIDKISPNEQMLQAEFWYVLIFHNCKLLNKSCTTKMESVIKDIRNKAENKHKNCPNQKLTVMICDFLDSKAGPFNWDTSTKISKDLMYRTVQRTLFKKYKNPQNDLYASIE